MKIHYWEIDLSKDFMINLLLLNTPSLMRNKKTLSLDPCFYLYFSDKNSICNSTLLTFQDYYHNRFMCIPKFKVILHVISKILQTWYVGFFVQALPRKSKMIKTWYLLAFKKSTSLNFLMRYHKGIANFSNHLSENFDAYRHAKNQLIYHWLLS